MIDWPLDRINLAQSFPVLSLVSVHEDDVRSTQTQLLTSQIINHIIYISILCRFVDILEWCKIKLDIRMKLADL